MKRLLLVCALLLLAAPAWAGHRTVSWTAPSTNEDGTPLTDLAGYKLYACPVQPCTKATGAVIAQPTTTSTPVSHGKQGFLFGTAVDTSGNESAESNVIPFDLLAPGTPSGLGFQ